MNGSNTKKAWVFGGALVALGAGAIGTSVVIAQDTGPERALERAAVDGALHKVDRRGDRDGFGFGGRRGGELMMGALQEADSDGDGALTQSEIDAYRDARVGAVDASGDGALDIEEFDTLYRELTRTRMVEAFQRLDEDGDGTITDAELDARFGGIVERLDRNGDGALSPDDRRGRHGRHGDRA